MCGLDEKYLLMLIYQLTIAQRALFSQSQNKDFEIFKLIHIISSFNLQNRNIDQLHTIIKNHCENDTILKDQVNYALTLAYNDSIKQ
ncbi:hypothetical protein [Bartonella sp. HY038]|uniref:hypothetical protein n=1 Tax=Bartonella sp. HY038 TaxID=2759660 RepID=UPI0015F81D11|nr:hypothetical protein [Bartonella sp. HY038]